jgi:hypothetical protein
MITLPDIFIPAKKRAPIDQMDQGMELLHTVHAALQDHSFIDDKTLLALSGTMFTVIETLGPVRELLNQAGCDDGQIDSPKVDTPNLLEAISEYQAACQRFEKQAEFDTRESEGAAIEDTYAEPMRVLSEWNKPLQSLEEVREAIRLVFTEQAIADDTAKEPLRAALIYLEKITGWKGGDA